MGTLLITEGNVTGLAGYKPVGSGSLRRPALPGLLVSRFCCLVSTAGLAWLGLAGMPSLPPPLMSPAPGSCVVGFLSRSVAVLTGLTGVPVSRNMAN